MKISLLAFCLALSCSLAHAECLQDQATGYQFVFTNDKVHKYVYGTGNFGTVCSGASTWPLTGSYTVDASGILALELTAANPSVDNCVPIFTIKGPFPNFEWYYDTGIVGVTGTWVSCGAEVPANASGKSLLK